MQANQLKVVLYSHSQERVAMALLAALQKSEIFPLLTTAWWSVA